MGGQDEWVPRSALARLQAPEQASLLMALLAKHPEWRPEAEAMAAERLSAASAEGVAQDVVEALLGLDLDAFHLSTSSVREPHASPDELAFEWLEEAIAHQMTDLKRKAEAGFVDAAIAIGQGLIVGLKQAEAQGPECSVLGWCPDFPAQAASEVVVALCGAIDPDGRGLALQQLLAGTSTAAPDWAPHLRRAAGQV